MGGREYRTSAITPDLHCLSASMIPSPSSLPAAIDAPLDWARARLAGDDAVVYSDERNHASIVDGCRLSRSRVEVFRHHDCDDLAARLRSAAGRPVIVSDTVFSMDGTVADVGGLVDLAHLHGAWLVLDEAHATGVLGPGGRGALAAAGVDARHPPGGRTGTPSQGPGAQGAAGCRGPGVRQLLPPPGPAPVLSPAPPHPPAAP